jgi:flagellar hook-length control protein FliK
VALQFSLEPIGPLHVRLTLADGAVASAFWAERAESVAVIRDHLPMLEAALTAAGLQVGRLSAQAGRPPQPAADIPPPLTGLLDERA